jgi:polysaccharide pyruvyl transferase WcaK-like protein
MIDNLNKLQIYSTVIASAISTFLGHYQNSNFQQGPGAQPASDSEEVQRAREKILSLLTKIKTSIWGPTDFLQHLASQVCITNTFPLLSSTESKKAI